MFILKFVLYMFRKDTPFIIRSLRITVYAAVLHVMLAVIRKLLMNGVSFRNM